MSLLAFIHVAKTGGRTVDRMLRSSFGPRHCKAVPLVDTSTSDPGELDYVVPKYGPDDFRLVRRWCLPLRSIAGHPIALWSDLESVVPDVRYFAFLREPMARGASHYQYTVTYDRPGLTWQEWVAWPVVHDHQTKMFARQADVAEAISEIRRKQVFIGLLERFDESLVMLRKLRAPDLKIAYERANVARDNSLAQKVLADPQARADMQQMYQADAELYDFVVRDLYPSFQRAYGADLDRDVQEFQKRRHRVNRLNMMLSRTYERLVFAPTISYQRHKRRRNQGPGRTDIR
jgi:hypothetical protein